MVPAKIAERYPDTIEAIASAGFEIGSCGQGVEDFQNLSKEQQIETISTSNEVISAITGRHPVGFTCPSPEWNEHLPCVLDELGFRWCSLTRGDDRPYLLESYRGRTGMIEIPTHWEQEEVPYFLFNYQPAAPAGQPRIARYSEVLAGWKRSFDAYREYGLCFVLNVDPQSIGRPGRMKIFEDILEYAVDFSDVWCATGAEVAAWWSTQVCPDQRSVAGQPDLVRLHARRD